MHVLGIDAGGTKTVCLLADEDGRVVAAARGGGANLQAAGELEVEKVLHELMEEAIGSRAVAPTAICLGIAGVDREEDNRLVHGIMRRIGYKARILVVNDALIALMAGAPDAPAVVIIAGTGSIAYGRNASGVAARAGGWGYVLGDEGSGYWIGRLALRAVVRQADGRGGRTLLTPLVLQHFDVAKPQDLVNAIYYRDVRPPAIAAVARYVQEAFDDGDSVAAHILDRAAAELVTSAASVTSQLGMTEDEFPFILAGGMFQAIPWLVVELPQRLNAIAARSRAERLESEPATGAIRLALAEARGGARLPAYVTAR